MRYFTLFAFIAIAIIGQAQQRVLFEDGRNDMLVYSYNNVQGNSQNSVRNMIREASPQNYQSSGFDLRFYKYVRFMDAGRSTIQGQIEIKDVYGDNAPKYKGFEMDDAFVPLSVSFQLQVFENNIAIYTQDYRDLSIDNHTIAPIRMSLQDTNGIGTYRAEIKNLEFTYTSRSVTRVRDRIASVSNYEKAAVDLDQMGRRLTAINTQTPDPDFVPTMVEDVSGMERNFQQISTAVFWNDLKINQAGSFDPLNMRTMSNQFAQTLAAKKQMLTGLMNNLHILQYEKAIALYDGGKKVEAQQALTRSLQVQENFPPSNYMMAMLDFENGKFDQSEQRVSRLINQIGAAKDILERTFKLATNLSNRRLDNGDNFLKTKEYGKAIAEYQKGYTFAKGLRGFQFNAKDYDDAINHAYNLDLTDRANVAVELHKQRNYDQALVKIDEAIAFQKQNNIRSDYDLNNFRRTIIYDHYTDLVKETESEIASGKIDQLEAKFNKAEAFHQKHAANLGGVAGTNSDIQAIKRRAYTAIYEYKYRSAQQDLDANRLESALRLAREAADVAKNKPVTINNNEPNALIERVQLKIYKGLISEGDALSTRGDNNLALSKYNAAKQLDLEYNFSVKGDAKPVEEKVTGTAKAELISRINAILYNENATNQELRTGLQNASQMASQYSLSYDSEVKDAMNKVEAKICSNAKLKLFGGKMDEIDFAIKGNNYISAKAKHLEAADILKEYPSCGIDNSRWLALRSQIEECALYQETVNKGIAAEKSNDYKGAIRHFVDATGQYNFKKLVSGNLTAHSSHDIYAYIKAKENASYNLEGSNHLVELKQTEQAWDLLKRCLAKATNIKATKNVQSLVGTALADLHFKPEIKWKDAVKNVIPKELGNKARFVCKAFRKRYKQLD